MSGVLKGLDAAARAMVIRQPQQVTTRKEQTTPQCLARDITTDTAPPVEFTKALMQTDANLIAPRTSVAEAN